MIFLILVLIVLALIAIMALPYLYENVLKKIFKAKSNKKKIFWSIVGILAVLGIAYALTAKQDTATPVAPRPELAQVEETAPAPVIEQVAETEMVAE